MLCRSLDTSRAEVTHHSPRSIGQCKRHTTIGKTSQEWSHPPNRSRRHLNGLELEEGFQTPDHECSHCDNDTAPQSKTHFHSIHAHTRGQQHPGRLALQTSNPQGLPIEQGHFSPSVCPTSIFPGHRSFCQSSEPIVQTVLQLADGCAEQGQCMVHQLGKGQGMDQCTMGLDTQMPEQDPVRQGTSNYMCAGMENSEVVGHITTNDIPSSSTKAVCAPKHSQVPREQLSRVHGGQSFFWWCRDDDTNTIAQPPTDA